MTISLRYTRVNPSYGLCWSVFSLHFYIYHFSLHSAQEPFHLPLACCLAFRNQSLRILILIPPRWLRDFSVCISAGRILGIWWSISWQRSLIRSCHRWLGQTSSMTWTKGGLKSRDHTALTVKDYNHSFDEWSRGRTQVSTPWSKKSDKGSAQKEACKRKHAKGSVKVPNPKLKQYKNLEDTGSKQLVRQAKVQKTGYRNKRVKAEPKATQQMSHFKIKEDGIIYNPWRGHKLALL